VGPWGLASRMLLGFTSRWTRSCRSVTRQYVQLQHVSGWRSHVSCRGRPAGCCWASHP
jgi:hypothetical protein